MDKKVAGLVKDVMGKGEKMAPVKSLKLKVKFHKPSKSNKSAARMNKAAEKMFTGNKYSK